MIKMVNFVICIFPQFKLLKNVLITKEKKKQEKRQEQMRIVY